MKDLYQFTGEYECKLDAKGRVKLPTNLLRQIASDGVSLNFVMNRGFEKHLMLYPNAVWEKKTKEINQLNIYNTRQRQAMRYFYRGATRISSDSADRILIPKNLIAYAGIKKDLVLFAYYEHIEIWSKDAYDKVLAQEPEDFSELAEGLFGNQTEFPGLRSDHE